MTTAIAASGKQRRQAKASWQRRALNAEEALKTAYAEIGAQRERIGILLGQIRDLQAEYAENTVQRVCTTPRRRWLSHPSGRRASPSVGGRQESQRPPGAVRDASTKSER